MNESRIAALKKMEAENPNDPFPAYAIALEYRSSNDYEKAIELLMALFKKFPNYLPLYYTIVSLFISKEDKIEALNFARKGINLAKKQGHIKTVSELKSLIELELDCDDLDD